MQLPCPAGGALGEALAKLPRPLDYLEGELEGNEFLAVVMPMRLEPNAGV